MVGLCISDGVLYFFSHITSSALDYIVQGWIVLCFGLRVFQIQCGLVQIDRMWISHELLTASDIIYRSTFTKGN